MRLFRRLKVRKRLSKWKKLRAKRIEKEKAEKIEKAKIRKKLMERYNLMEEHKGVFWHSRTEEDCYSHVDEDGNSINLSVGDIVPFRRRGDLVFFYEITDSRRKFGDYGYSDYATFHDLKYHHHEKIPEKVVDPKKSLKIKWDKVDDKTQYGYVQGIRVIKLKLRDKRSYSNSIPTEVSYVKDNFISSSYIHSLPRYYDFEHSLTEAKNKAQKKINKLVREKGIKIKQYYIPHKIRRKNR